MALLDISQVTSSLVTLLETHIQASSIWPGGQTLSVVPDPPDRLAGSNALGVYLYHIEEDPHNKNMLPVGNSQPPIRYTPMPLLLYYQLSAHSDLDSPTGSFREQLILGAAVKALHDYPVINNETVVGNPSVPVLTGSIIDNNNRFSIELRPVTADEAVNFWTAGSSPLRLAAYYRVSVIMLEPELLQSSAAPVLNYELYAFPGKRPFITGSSYEATIQVPGETTSREFSLQPAQVPVGGTFSLRGVNFISDDTTLVITSSDWEEEHEIMPVDWVLQVAAWKIQARVPEFAGAREIVPGTYSIAVKTLRNLSGTSGGVYPHSSLSNRTSISIVPRIDSISVPNTNGEFTITGGVFEHSLIAADELKIFINDALLEVGTPGLLNPGEYVVIDASQIVLRLPAVLDITPPSLRLSIKGAEALTQWVAT